MFAYKDMSIAAFEAVKKANGDFETEESRQALEKDLIMLAVFGLEDEERPKTKKVIKEFKKAKVNTRIVSGDHRDCVLKLAAHFDLYSEANDSDFTKVNNIKKAVSGKEF
jgi:P-type E1-E2 ATPase